MDLTVEGKTYINGVFEKCCIGIKDGKISSIKKILKSDEHIDVGNKLILPAGVDLHVHFRDPGLTNKEDFHTGSTAAAFGGISCIFDMPNTIPQTTTINNLSDKIVSCGKKSFVDFGVYAGITDSNIEHIDTLAKKTSGFKIYLGSSTNTLIFDNKNLKKVLSKIKSTKKLVLFHAEDEELLKKHKTIENNLTDHIRSHPAVCEETSIKNIFNASKQLDTKIHICHVSSCEGLELLKKRSKNISFGVTPHHSLLSIDATSGNECFYKVNPPIRSKFDKEILFNALKNGVVDILESDHAPHTLEEKNMDFDNAPSGVPGVETMYPLFLYLAKKDVLSFQQLISLLCIRPAKLVNVPKGKIEVGYDADLVVVDPKNDYKISSDMLHSKCGWSPFEGWPAVFPEAVFVRGERVIDDHEIQVKQGFGRFVGG